MHAAKVSDQVKITNAWNQQTVVSSLCCQHGGKDRCQLIVLSAWWQRPVSVQCAVNMVLITSDSSLCCQRGGNDRCQLNVLSTL